MTEFNMNRILRISFVGIATLAATQVSAVSPYINKVYEFCPAPGQFVNEIPEYEPGDDYAAMLAKAQEQLAGSARGGMVSLGAFGGYVTFGFDHRILNKPGEYDFKVNGNAIVSDRDNMGGSCEPGIILVSIDANGNGEPDDEWYEIKGSEYDNPTTFRGYEITYYRPADNHAATPDPDDSHIVDVKYIRWTSNDSSNPQGYIQRNDNHDQSYWPMWLDSTVDKLSFVGSRLAPNAYTLPGDTPYWVLGMLGEGYADNMPTVENHGLVDPGVNIEWAVKSDGTPANLEGIDFVRVYTAMNQTCGQLGETSTEVVGAEDLHPEYSSVDMIRTDSPVVVALKSAEGVISLRSGYDEAVNCMLVSVSGSVVKHFTLAPGDNTIEIPGIVKGIYIVALPNGRAVKIAI